MPTIGSILRSLVLGPSADRETTGPGQDRASPHLPDQRTIYAIGDVHGRADCLQRLIEVICEDVSGTAAGSPVLLFLGDYIDRGDESRAVLDICTDIAAVWQDETVFLRGNHEDAMMTFLSDPVGGAAWLRFGGLSTLMSYGVPNVSESMSEGRLVEAAATLARQLPEDHLHFLETTRLTHTEGNVHFCHAGVDPDQEIGNQSPRTLMWGEGTAAPAPDYPYIVVHGHVVVDGPVLRPREVNVDTGAYFSGHLTCARIASGSIRFLQT